MIVGIIGLGYVGFPLSVELNKHYDVIVLDNLSTGRLENIKSLGNIKWPRISFGISSKKTLWRTNYWMVATMGIYVWWNTLHKT